MKPLISDQQIEYFRRNGKIEFENVLSREQMDSFKTGPAGVQRDLWRQNPSVRKVISSRQLGQIAYSLSGIKPLRIGYDMRFGKEEEREPGSLKEVSCIQGLACGLVVPYGKVSVAEGGFFSSEEGPCVFIHPELELDFNRIAQEAEGFYLAVYASYSAQYIPNKRDPCVNSLKKFKYGFGDRLRDAVNPVVFR